MREATIFVDSSAFTVLADRDHSGHEPARQFRESLRNGGATLHTTNFVLDETFTWIRRRLGLPAVTAFHGDLLATKALKVFTVEPVIEAEAWRIMSAYEDKDFSFTDCTSFAVMQALRIDRAFAFDKHFAQFGFQLLP